MSVQITSGESTCRVFPAAGGSIGSWRVAEQDMFRPCYDPKHAVETASFPLVPFSNRIAHGNFLWNDQRVQLTPHPMAIPHAHHGVGWDRAWVVTNAEKDQVTLELIHNGDAHWPWPFKAVQEFHISNDALSVAISAQNLADISVPLSVGHHPFFDSAGATLCFSAGGFYAAGPDRLPLEREAISPQTDFANSRSVLGIELDNLYADWRGLAKISWVNRPFSLTLASDLPHLALYIPDQPNFFCCEPVAHIHNAVNRSDGDMPIVEPGASTHGTIRFVATPAPCDP